MKKRLAKWLLLVAKRLDSDARIENAQAIEDYEAKKIGLTYEVTKKDVKEYRFKDGARMSLREGKSGLIREVKRNIRKHVIGCIDANHLIEYDVKESHGNYRISGELKIYVRRPDNEREEEK